MPEPRSYPKGHRLYGKGVAYIKEEPKPVQPKQTYTAESLLAAFNSPNFRPPMLPRVAMELIQLSEKPDVELVEITDLLEQDSLLVGKVLNLVNSSLYGGRSEIRSLRSAIIRLGLDRTQNLFIQVALNMKVFQAEGYNQVMDKVRVHSVVVATLCRIISQYTPIDGEFAFLCGILHDVGIAGLLSVLAYNRPKNAPRQPIERFWSAIMAVHEKASLNLTKTWKLQSEIQFIVGHHHQLTHDGHPHPVIATIMLADRLSNELGITLDANSANDYDPASEFPADLRAAVDSLRINEQVLGMIRNNIGELIETGAM